MVYNAGPKNHYATHAREVSLLHLGHCPRTTGKGQEYVSELCLRQSEILMLSSQNRVLPQQDKVRPHSTTPSQSLSSPLLQPQNPTDLVKS